MRSCSGPEADGAAMNRLLADLRIVEFSAFVAAPLGGMTMAQFGAEVIRIDPIGGAVRFARPPRPPGGPPLLCARSTQGTASGGPGAGQPRAAQPPPAHPPPPPPRR